MIGSLLGPVPGFEGQIQTKKLEKMKPMKLSRKRGLLPAVVAAATLTTGLVGFANGQNAIVNGDFENGTTGWNLLGSNPPNATIGIAVDPLTGSNAATASIDNTSTTIGASLLYQQIQPVGSIDGTQLYDFTFEARLDNSNLAGLGIFANLLFLDQDGSNGGGVQQQYFEILHLQGISDTYQTFSFTGLDPTVGADSFELQFQLAPGAVPGIQNTLYVDNASLTPQVVPEPSSFGLAVAAGISGLLRRRRK